MRSGASRNFHLLNILSVQFDTSFYSSMVNDWNFQQTQSASKKDGEILGHFEVVLVLVRDV